MNRTFFSGRHFTFLPFAGVMTKIQHLDEGWRLFFPDGARRLMDKRGTLHDDTPTGREALSRVGPSFRAGGQRVYDQAEVERYAAPEGVLRTMQARGQPCFPETVLAEYFATRRIVTEGSELWHERDPDDLIFLVNPNHKPFREPFRLRRDGADLTLLVGEDRTPRLVMTLGGDGKVAAIRTDFAL